jgi:putative oligomerization/nucleic acid binding protein
MPGLVRGVARTAAVVGTATAVSNRVSRRQSARWAEQDAAQQAAYAQQPVYAQEVVPPAPPDVPTQLKQLAELRDQGILTPAEFEAQKAKVLAG